MNVNLNRVQPLSGPSVGQWFGRLITWIIFLVFMVAAILLILTVVRPNSVRLMTVRSGSMEPALGVGSLVVVEPTSSYQVGDIITYRPAASRELLTHRVVERTSTDQGIKLVTKGDANSRPDPLSVPEKQVLGRVSFSIPLVGYLFSFAQTQLGLILLVITPAIVIGMHEFRSMADYWRRRQVEQEWARQSEA